MWWRAVVGIERDETKQNHSRQNYSTQNHSTQTYSTQNQSTEVKINNEDDNGDTIPTPTAPGLLTMSQKRSINNKLLSIN